MSSSVFSQFVAQANDIRESGRWKALNERIKQMASKPSPGDEWYVQVFGQLCYQILLEYSSLKRAYDDRQNGDSSLLAWRARNLLELSVWATYFAKSRDNARRLYEDAGRDVQDLLSNFEAWGQKQAQPAEWLNSLADSKSELAGRAANEGIETLDARYMRVEKAAAESGLGEAYKMNSKLLSKFVHPTAMQILGVAEDATIVAQREMFFGMGCLFFTGAFSALEALDQ